MQTSLDTETRQIKRWIASFLLLLFGYNPPVFANEMLFCHEAEHYPPYIEFKDGQATKGILIKLISQAASQTGINAKFVARHWLKCQELVRQGRMQALFAMIQTPERSQIFQFPGRENGSQPYLMLSEYPLVVRRNGPLHLDNRLPSLVTEQGLDAQEYAKYRRYGLGAPSGYVVHDQMKQWDVLADLNWPAVKGLQMVALGKLDGYSLDRRIGRALVAQLELGDQLVMSQAPVLSSRWHVPFNRQTYQKHPALIQRFWQEVDRARAAQQLSAADQ